MTFIPMEKRSSVSSPSTVYFPKKRQDMSKYRRLLDRLPDTEIEPEFQNSIISAFPSSQNHPEDLLIAKRAILRYNREAQYDGAVALTLHFIGFFHKSGYGYAPYSCVHLFEIASIRVKSQYKLLVLCKMGNSERTTDAIVNCRIISKDVVTLGQILYRNYMLSVVAFDPDYTCDFRTELKEQFPPFYPGLSPSQGYQFTYYAFTTNLGRRYYHDVARYYHEHIRNHDGVFDFGMLPWELREGPNANVKDLMPVIHAMMFVPIMDPNRSNEKFPYVHGIIVHRKQFPWIAKGIGRIVWKSQLLRFVHLSRIGLKDSRQLGAIGNGLIANPTIPCVYYNFENNFDVRNDGIPFLTALKTVTAKIFFLSVARCHIDDTRDLAVALQSNENLMHIKYLYFNGNMLEYRYAKPLIAYLEKRGRDAANNPIVRFGVGGDDATVEAVFSCLQRYPQPIEELSVAGTTMNRVGAHALIQYVRQTRTMRVLDLSGSGMDPEYIQAVLRAMSENEVVGPLRVRLNELRLKDQRLMSIAKGFLRSDLDRWESIEFRDNGFGVFELQFIISFLWRMNNLEEVDFSENFHAGMPEIGHELADLLLIKKLKRLRLAGVGGTASNCVALQSEGCVFLDHLLESGRTFEELDMSGNKMGAQGYEKMRQMLVKSDEMRELIVDGNDPENLSAIKEMIDVVKTKPNLTFFVFPYYDAMAYLREHSKDRTRERYVATDLQRVCNKTLNDRRHALGMSSMLPFHAVPELEQLVDEISGEMGSMQRCLEGVETGIHGGITKDIRVTLPYLNEGQDITEGGAVTVIDGPKQLEYHAQFINHRINEETYQIPEIALEDLDEEKDKKEKHKKDDKKEKHKKEKHKKEKHNKDHNKKHKKKSKKHKHKHETESESEEEGSASEPEEAKPAKGKERQEFAPRAKGSARMLPMDMIIDDDARERLAKTSRVPAVRGSQKASSRPASQLSMRKGNNKPDDDGSPERARKKGREDSESSEEAPRKKSRSRSPTRSSKREPEPSESSEEAPRKKSRSRSPTRSPKREPQDSESSEEAPPKKSRSRSPTRSPKREPEASESSEEEPNMARGSPKRRTSKAARKRQEYSDSYSDRGMADIPPSSSQISDSDSDDPFAKYKPNPKRSIAQRPPPPLNKRSRKND